VKERKLGRSRDEKHDAERKACVKVGWEVVVLGGGIW
jgi:hypothetical protein